MHRLVLEDITLWDAAVHSDPTKFDGYRIYRMRSGANNNGNMKN